MNRPHARMLTRISATIALAALAGCGSLRPKPELTPPEPVVAPYAAERGEVLFAVVPLRNETGTTLADASDMSDRLVAAFEEVRGIRVLPLNRTIEAMRTLEMDQVRTPADAERLTRALGADAVVIGTLTAYEPYDPQLGIALTLFAGPGPVSGMAPAPTPAAVDPRQLRSMPTESGGQPASRFASAPTNSISEHFDGKNHGVLEAVKRYAEGRTERPSALGWRRYVESMPLYQEFASHHVVELLMASEAARLGRSAEPESGMGG